MSEATELFTAILEEYSGFEKSKGKIMARDKSESTGDAEKQKRPIRSNSGAAALVGVKPADVLAYKDYGDHVIVVTVDGKKLRGNR